MRRGNKGERQGIGSKTREKCSTGRYFLTESEVERQGLKAKR